MNKLDLENYNNLNVIVEKCFDRLYSTLEFIFIFYGAIFAFSHDKMSEDIYQIGMFMYLLPIGTYVIGLLFISNMFSIVRATQYMLEIENRITTLSWNKYCQIHTGARFLAYGTACALFIGAPILSFFLVFFQRKTGTLWDNTLIAYIIPAVMFITFVIFFFIIGTRIRKAKR